MSLMQISEPDSAEVGQSTRRKIAVGIDLGTTHSLVASVVDGVPITLADSDGEHLVPSVVHYARNDQLFVGRRALPAAVDDAANTIVSVKRLMGRDESDLRASTLSFPWPIVTGENGLPEIVVRHGRVNPIEVSAEILKALREQAESVLNETVRDAVITVPAYFDDGQRQATRDAAELAGLNPMRLINEPTAAAIAYGLDTIDDGVVVVYDLGGGTFDVSILHMEQGVFEVVATGGDTALGGDDMDGAIVNWIRKQLPESVAGGDAMLGAIRHAAIQAKIELTTEPHAVIDLSSIGGPALTLERGQFEALIQPLVDQTITVCKRVLRDAGLEKAEIRDVVLVGGATRVPLVKRAVAAFFAVPGRDDIDPDRVVAIGAAVQANILAGNRDAHSVTLLDVTPLSLGLETMGGLVEVIIPRNTPIPVSRSHEFTTFKDGQTAMKIHVVQGERDVVKACRSLANFTLEGIPPMVAGAARIDVTFQVDADGLLSVSARETVTNTRADVSVRPSYGLSDEQIGNMLRDSVQHADQDVQQRRLREQRVEGERVIEAINAALVADAELLDEASQRSIQAAVADLGIAVEGSDPDAIASAVDKVEQAASEFVQRRMNASINRVVAGKNISELTAEEN